VPEVMPVSPNADKLQATRSPDNKSCLESRPAVSELINQASRVACRSSMAFPTFMTLLVNAGLLSESLIIR
jgi:hypothetical protein